MKKWKRLLGALLSACLLCSAAVPALAAEEYTYTVTFHAGVRGTFAAQGVQVQGSDYSVQSDKQQIKVTGLKPGAVVSFDPGCVTVNQADNKYYVKGIRLSGRDNSTVSTSAIVLNGQSAYDQDYVIAYGLTAESVAYTVNYCDTAGKTLKSSRTYYGNVGDKPVAAYLYIEGYQPQAYNITKTLSAKAAENVFTFQYTKVSTQTSNNKTSSNTAAAVDGGTAVTMMAEAEATTGADTAAPVYQVVPLDNDTAPEASEPALLLDLDEESTTQTDAAGMNTSIAPTKQKHGVGIGITVVLAVLLAAAVAGGVWIRYRRKGV
ncbi:MAG: hypothetical protein Q4P20_06495 [Eubacteriales bacterium]|nr:hypothetical protein [Eubacteriales bacterium]